MNISWMYNNHCYNPSAITETYGTTDTSNYGTAKLADNNLQSYFLANGISSIPNILFNFGSQVYVDSLIVVHNLNETGTMYIKAGNTNPPTTVTYGIPILGSTGTSVNFFNSPVAYTFWQLFANGTKLSNPVKINEIFIGQKDTLPVNPEYPFKKEINSATIVTESEKGQRKVYHKYTKQKWNFSYPSLGDSLSGTLNKIRDFCNGSYKPFFFCEDIDNDKFATYFVRFVKNSYKKTQIAYGVQDIEFSIEEEL